MSNPTSQPPQSVELDTSSGFRYVYMHQIEGGFREAVYRVSEAGLFIRIALGLCSPIIMQLDNACP